MENIWRGKHNTTNEWIISNCLMQFSSSTKLLDCNDGWAEIEPGTLGKYSGFNDENDKEIFEGDFIKYNNFIFLVRIENGCFCLEAISDYEIPYYLLPTNFVKSDFTPKSCDNVVSFFDLTWNDDVWNIKFKVIGNIHDNPELLMRKVNG